MSIFSKIKSHYLIAVAAGVLYGVASLALTRFKIGGYYNSEGVYVDGISNSAVSVMTAGYVLILPLILGLIVVLMAPTKEFRFKIHKYVYYLIALPWTTVIICNLLAALFHWEGAICLIMGALIYLPLATIGALIGLGVQKLRAKNKYAFALGMGVFLVLPQSTSFIESRFESPVEHHHVETQIEISASAASVWQEIIRVKPINEPLTGFFYKMGFPKPIEATLSHEGVGGVRHAIFDKNLVFVETITDWDEQKLLSFAIKADPQSIPLTTLDEHVTVGGQYFDVLQGTYQIEDVGNGKVILHLSSDFRLSTNFNFYSSLWARFLMRDIQQSILAVIQKRCEG